MKINHDTLPLIGINAGGSGSPNPPAALTVANGEHRIGDLEAAVSVHVQGRVEGDISANQIVITRNGRVDGAIVAQTVHIEGAVNGPIVASHVSLGPSARVKGNIDYDALNITGGASVCGICRDRSRQISGQAGSAARGSELSLPFSRARAACGKCASRLQPPLRPRTMRAVWEGYVEAAMCDKASRWARIIV